MAPIRRYLRISKYSVLETRIYLDNPALAQSWLLNPRDPVLPRVIESVRPLVLPKLREEQDRERSRKKGKVRSIKDVVVEDEFEVSIFLTQTETRHSLLYKQKIFRDKTQTKLKSNSSKLTGGDTLEAPIDVDNATLASEQKVDNVPILREEDEDDQELINLDDIPGIHEAEQDPSTRRPKRRRQPSDVTGQDVEPGTGSNHDDDDGSSDCESRAFQTIDTDSSDDELFVGDSGHDEEARPPPPKRRKEKEPDRDARDDKKELAMDISYEGFAIYGRVLCLVVKRRDGWGARSGNATALPGARSQTGRPGGQAMMENWITSTQLPAAEAAEDETT
ncbi:hypothetical protein QBC34DRAFT_136243 [Podospora aff. communis PSN243]|uniref:Uncharacterized protein n=1 Tax=Podospora aff. communis PSN243 TaxID=3040156 RepID=A0AAV9H3Y4_9PEZI|nr:hypothetical protein QBC34DRAFT_136243 [Podospora aff. communis PSN243]